MSYRIVLPLGSDPAANLATVDSLLAHVAAPDSLLVVGESTDLAALLQLRPALPGGAIEATVPATPAEGLAALLPLAPEHDLLVVWPGILAVPLLDLRLAWSAASAPGIGGVSPSFDGANDAVEVDGRLAAAPLRPVVDAASLRPECCYLRRESLASLAAGSAGAADLQEVLRRRGYALARAPHVCVGSTLPRLAEPTELPPAVPRLDGAIARTMVARKVRPRVLHVTHSLGGGLERWVELFAASGETTESWILRAVGERGRFGSELWLFDAPGVARPRRTWKFDVPIAATAIRHLAYRQALEEIVADLGIDAVLVSSLIGHSLDVLRTGLPTGFVCHDYYPFCSALHIHFGGVCTSCSADRLQRCRLENPVGEIFEDRDARGWLALREAFFAAVTQEGVRMVAPSASVERNYRRLAPELTAVPFTVIGHGDASAGLLPLRKARQGHSAARGGRPLRAVVLGRLSPIKGRELFLELAQRTAGKVELHVVGCGAGWAAGLPSGVEVVAEYGSEELAGLLERIDPDVALLLSTVPETFSFTLGECFAAGVPPLATRIGSFEDRIVDGITGFLAEPSAAAVASRLRSLADDREALAAVERRLATMPQRSWEVMVGEYVRLLGLPRHSPSAYFSRVAGAAVAGEGTGDHGTWLPPSSPLGFADFLRQFERGTRHHIRVSRRLRPWQRRLAGWLAERAFAAGGWLLRRL